MSDKKNTKPKFTFNSFWLYIPIFVILLGLSIFNSGDMGSKNISKNEFTKILVANDIQKIVVENNNVAQLFLKADAEKKEDHKKATTSPFYRKGSPLYTYNFGDLQNFENEISKQKAENNLTFDKVNNAIKNKLLVLHRQEIRCLNQSQSYKHYEMLVRIADNDSLIYPDQFIGAAEKFGLISKIGDLVLNLACIELCNLNKKGFTNIVFKSRFVTIKLSDKFGLAVFLTSLDINYFQKRFYLLFGRGISSNANINFDFIFIPKLYFYITKMVFNVYRIFSF